MIYRRDIAKEVLALTILPKFRKKLLTGILSKQPLPNSKKKAIR